MRLNLVWYLIITMLLFGAGTGTAQDQEASDFVVGLNALNTQIKDSLARQPTRRVAVVPFVGADGNNFPRVSAFLAEQLITALVSSGDVTIVDSTSIVNALNNSGESPLRLGSVDIFPRIRQEYENTNIVVGTITDLDTKIAVMVRIINGGTGQFTGGAMVYLKVADEFAALVKHDRPMVEKNPADEMTKPTDQKEAAKQEKTDTKPAETKPKETTAKQEQPVEEKPVDIPRMTDESDVVIYNEGRKFFVNNQFTAATKVFEQLLSRYPDSPYADNAVYWIGECFYSKKQWQNARDAFQRVLDTYPYGNKVPDATFKRGFAEEKMGDIDRAIFSMEEVIRRFGNAEISVRAREKLQRLRAAKQQG